MKELLSSYDRINSISQIINAKNYLEIGVSSGNTFFKVDAPFKVGVDPSFKFDHHQHSSSSCIFYPCTSDVFFQEKACKLPSFDLIYIDGLHTFEQTLRDFIFSLAFSHEKTVWLFDDTVPLGIFSSLKNYRNAKVLRTLLGVKTGAWAGDVYKVIFVIHDFFPQFSYLTFLNHGQTAVWRKSRSSFQPVWNTLSRISSLNYYNFLYYKNSYLNFSESQDILRQIEASVGRDTDE